MVQPALLDKERYDCSMRPEPRPQEIYRHFKGNVYQIITLARHSETGEKMVVYQQLHAPYEVYTRPLEMFMSRIDTRKYPNEKQIHRFARVDVRGEENTGKPKETSAETLNRILSKGKGEPAAQEKPEESAGDCGLDPGLLEFLDADSYEKKLQILRDLHLRITDEMIDTMAASLETEVRDGDIEERYGEIKNYLITMERFECHRLRS